MTIWRNLLLILMLGLFTLPVTTLAQGLQFDDILPADITSLKKSMPDIFKDSVSINLSEADEALRQLMATGHYENVAIDRNDKEQFTLIGKPLRVIEAIRFTGNKGISTATLTELIEIKVGERFERKKAVQAGERLKEYYGESGFFNAVIDLNFIKSDSNNMILSFSVRELSTTRIETIDIETTNPHLKSKLNSLLRNRLRKPLTTQRVESMMEEINSYLLENRYLVSEVAGPVSSYNTDKSEAYLKIEITEPFRWEFFFEGNQFASISDLYKALDLHNRERKNLEPATEGAERIKRHYLSRGLPHVQVDAQIKTFALSYLKRVNFQINEGPRVQLQKLDISGRISRSGKYYYNFVLNNSSDLVYRGYYNRQDLEQGFKNMITELRNQGYLRARVQSTRIEYNRARNKVIVYALLDEGPLTQIRTIDFEGNKSANDQQLSQAIKLGANQPLRLNALEEGIISLKKYYNDHGFLEMKLLNEGEELIQYNDAGTQARLLFKLFEGPKIRINSISVEGNHFTKSRVILNEADLRVGEILTPKKIEDAASRLNRMGIFARADIRTLEEGTNVSDRTLVISVVERDPGTFRFGAGVNDERGFTARGFSGISYNNIFGTARAVSARLEVRNNLTEVRYLEKEVSAGYLEPFLLNTRTRGRIHWTRSDRVFDYTPKDRVTNITLSNRFDFLLERDLSRQVRLTWKALSLDLVQSFERYGRCVDDVNGTTLTGGSCSPREQQIGLIGPTLEWDYRDNPFVPSKGYFNRFSIDYSDPSFGSTDGIQFIKVENSYTHYLPIFGRTVWANSLRGGYISNLSENQGSGVPASQAFFLGGLFTVRGFDSSSNNDRIPPDWQLPIGRSTDIVVRDHSQYGLFKSELRFIFSGEHGGVVFYDGGFVKVSGVTLDRPYRDAVGFGYRYNTPVGPLAADIAFKINPRKDNGAAGDRREDQYRVHFSIGTF